MNIDSGILMSVSIDLVSIIFKFFLFGSEILIEALVSRLLSLLNSPWKVIAHLWLSIIIVSPSVDSIDLSIKSSGSEF